MAIGTFEYYDPDTGMLHLWQHSLFDYLPGSSSDTFAIGLSDTTFTDVTMKVVSIHYMTKIFSDTVAPYDANLQMFDTEEYSQSGLIIAGVRNQNAGTINDLNDFEGTSAWPVDTKSYGCGIGNPASYSKTWKPNKLAISHEQQAFLTIRALAGGNTNEASYTSSSIYIRGIRL